MRELVIDPFAGGGGASEGVRAALRRPWPEELDAWSTDPSTLPDGPLQMGVDLARGPDQHVEIVLPALPKQKRRAA